MTDSSLLYAPEDQCLSTIFMIINNFALILKFAPLLPHTHYPPSPPPSQVSKQRILHLLQYSVPSRNSRTGRFSAFTRPTFLPKFLPSHSKTMENSEIYHDSMDISVRDKCRELEFISD